ncbi:methionyl-tRNA formyltransferase [Spirochaetia bacterium]|nr:methionyl-tRNA formyltransferase [Spirochaetia bacterium]
MFAGSPAIAVPALEALVALGSANGNAVGGADDNADGGADGSTDSNAGFELAGVLTNPDSARGRHGKLEPTGIGAAAERLAQGIPVLKPAKLDAEVREQTAALKADLLVSFAYGRIFGPKFLALFPQGGINIHPSLLPQYRGPTPIPAAILNCDHETGISIQRLAPEMDSGDILIQERFALNGRETTASLGEIMAQKAAQLLPETLKGLAAGSLRGTPQNHGEASYCSLIAKEEGLIDWSKSAREIDARIRAFDPWPLCWTKHGGQQLFILKAEPLDATAQSETAGLVLGIDKQRGILVQTGEGVLAVTELQYQTKKALEWRAFLNGARNFAGSRLG